MKKILIYSTIAIALLYVIRELEYIGIRKNRNGEFAKLRIAFEEKNNFNLLFIGSSRAECEFYPPIIDSATGLNSFNLGMTGATMPLIKTSLEAYLVHSPPPKYIVLNLDLHSFVDSPDTIFNFPRYFPYLDNEKLLEGLQNRDRRFRFFKWMAPYSMAYFNIHYFNESLRGWFDKPGNYDAGYVKGYAPSQKDLIRGDLDTLFLPYFLSTPKKFVWDNLDSIVGICRKSNIQLSLVVAPIFHRLEDHVTNYKSLDLDFSEYAANNSLPYMDFSEFYIKFQSDYYSDIAHLNAKGAKCFSREFSSAYRQYIAP